VSHMAHGRQLQSLINLEFEAVPLWHAKFLEAIAEQSGTRPSTTLADFERQGIPKSVFQ
jgi:hypothetical protein